MISALGISWGLPSRDIDKYLFGKGEVWSGEKIYRLASAGDKFSSNERNDEGSGHGRGDSQRRGADVDADPLVKDGGESIPLTATDEDVAKIYLRYRLYTYQPDEMITMMALAGMRPSKLELDPKLYQYGGLFIYPVGALIKLCGMVGLIDLRGDVVYYLDHPDEFGKLYVVARAYSAAWGLVGVFVVFAIGRRITREWADFIANHPPHPPLGKGGRKSEGNPERLNDASTNWAGVLAATLFAVMPVVVCMSHEGKPHLPGAVLMLLAVLFGMRCVSRCFQCVAMDKGTSIDRMLPDRESPRRLKPAAQEIDWWLMCGCCGAAFGMVLSSWPIFVLIPLVAWLTRNPPHPPLGKGGRRNSESEIDATEAQPGKAQPGTAQAGEAAAGKPPMAPVFVWSRKSVVGVVVGVAVYLVTNPYICINLLTNRDVLASNFGNSMAMYDVSRVVEGFVRVVELTIEGATVPVLILGALALLLSMKRRRPIVMVMVVPAIVFFLQFVLIGAGKPAEYGRFGIFSNTALAIGAACLVTIAATRFARAKLATAAVLSVLLIAWSGFHARGYLCGFMADAGSLNSRRNLASILSHAPLSRSTGRVLVTLAEPAPYCFPPIDFARINLVLVDKSALAGLGKSQQRAVVPVESGGAVRWKNEFFGSSQFTVGTNMTSPSHPSVLLTSCDSTWRPRNVSWDTPISWANKPFFDSYRSKLIDVNTIPLGR